VNGGTVVRITPAGLALRGQRKLLHAEKQDGRGLTGRVSE